MDSTKCDVMEKLKRWTANAHHLNREEVLQLLTFFECFRDDVEVSTEIIRALRNACSDNTEATDVIAANRDFVIKLLRNIADWGYEDLSEPQLIFRRCSLQFIQNALVHQPQFQVELIPTIKMVVSKSLASTDFKVKSYASSLLLLILKCHPREDAAALTDVGSLAHLLTLISSDSKFAIFCVKMLVECHPTFIKDAYKNLEPENRLVLLHFLDEDNKNYSPDLVQMIVEAFKIQAAQILTTLKNSQMPSSPAETVTLLSIICELSCMETSNQSMIQADKSLLIDAVYLLRMMHEVGKSESTNIFTPISKIADLAANSEFERNPVFGFKRDLIRLIGNLCWHHADNQNLVREIDGIPLLLDCSPIDGKNPFIMQWVIFALRNLCHNNRDNQETVSKLDGPGVVLSSLEVEFGLKIMKEK